MTAPQATDPGAFLDRLEQTWKAATSPEEFWERCGCLQGLGEIPSVSDCHQAGLCQMRRSDRERNASGLALIAAVRGVLALVDELDGLVDDETVDETARIAHAWTLRRLRSAVTAALGATGGER